MLQPNFSKALYKDSPFLPLTQVATPYLLLALTREHSLHPAVAVATETVRLADEHADFLDTQRDWIAEKFPIVDNETHDYYFGLILPPALLLATFLIKSISLEDTLYRLFPDPDLLFDEARLYLTRHIIQASKLVDFSSYEPMISAEPIYNLCNLEVYSDNYWHLVGLEASKYLYTDMARLFDYPFLKQTLL